MTSFVVFLKEFIALYCLLHWALYQENLDIHSWIISCPHGITPNSGLTGSKNTIYIYIYVCVCVCVCVWYPILVSESHMTAPDKCWYDTHQINAHKYKHKHIYIYIYICVCVCVCNRVYYSVFLLAFHFISHTNIR